MKLKEIASLIGGTLKGDPEVSVEGVSSPENPREGTLIFCSSLKDARKAAEGKPAALVLKEDFEYPNRIVVGDVRLALALFLERFYPEKHPEGVSEFSVVHESVRIGPEVYVGPFAVIEEGVVLERGVKVYPFCYVGRNSYIGEDTILFSGVSVYPGTVIGRRVRIHSGAVIGADGFGYHTTEKGIIKLNHIGRVVIEDDVEVGANTTVDRALIDQTRIGAGTKVDNLVMIAHNCDIGVGNILVGQVGLSGSVRTGRGVILAGQVGVADHVRIGDGVTVTAKSGVTRDLESGKVYGANLPAVEWMRWKRVYALLLKLPELFKRHR
jgi:UDP-3-O-[3-hydroxymyristoyl] glucosamine N-acyltransferase